eukprot:TRINITY_DN20429_c0_g1_i1.p1 TRINITY_DN20429_c0_g1~~TRINITY_DN20429_c0_g1_i1.p1  ORF type:complete len:194 (-),score=28.25 TRINITY_DN20429_c0_g1_i1:113-694(-)
MCIRDRSTWGPKKAERYLETRTAGKDLDLGFMPRKYAYAYTTLEDSKKKLKAKFDELKELDDAEDSRRTEGDDDEDDGEDDHDNGDMNGRLSRPSIRNRKIHHESEKRREREIERNKAKKPEKDPGIIEKFLMGLGCFDRSKRDGEILNKQNSRNKALPSKNLILVLKKCIMLSFWQLCTCSRINRSVLEYKQ